MGVVGFAVWVAYKWIYGLIAAVVVAKWGESFAGRGLIATGV